MRTKGIMSTFFRPISPRTIFTAWCSDQRPNFSGINLGVSHGTRWNMMELYFGGGYMRLPTRIWWKNMENMEKQQTLQGLSGASKKRFLFGFPRLSNKTWPLLKLKMEPSWRTKSKITAETVAPFRSFQYLSVVAHAKRIFYDIFQMLFVTWSELVCMSNSFCSETLAETGEGPAQFPQTQKQVAWPTAVLNQLESQKSR